MRKNTWLSGSLAVVVLTGTLVFSSGKTALAFDGGDACWDGFVSNEEAADAANLGWIERAYWYMGNLGQYYACRNLEMSTNQ